jgi:putative ABC transport system ATP-binding protein
MRCSAITHDEALARRADRVVRIEDGRLSEAAGLPAEVRP